jgi:hypothetical protein
MLEILSALLVGMVVLFFYTRRKPKNYPPGASAGRQLF